MLSSLTSALPWPADPLERKRCLLLALVLTVGLVYSFWQDKPGWSDPIMTALLWGAALVTVPRSKPYLPRELVLPLCAFLLANEVAVVFSRLPGPSLRAWVGMVAYVAIFLLAGNVITAWGHRVVFRAVGLASGVLLYVFVTVWFGAGAPLSGYRLTVETNNSLALYSLLLLPALATGEISGLVMGGALFTLWFSGSRGALAGLIGGLLVLGEGLGRRAGGVLAWVRRHWRLTALASGLAGLLLIYALALPHGDRGTLWGISWEMFASRPLVGQGLATFQVFWMTAYPHAALYGHAHNLFLNWLAETGLLGLAAGLWLLLAGGRALRAAYRAGNRWAPGVIAAAVALGIQSLVDMPTSSPYIAVTALVLLQLALIPEAL